jgi:hypothetical protein
VVMYAGFGRGGRRFESCPSLSLSFILLFVQCQLVNREDRDGVNKHEARSIGYVLCTIKGGEGGRGFDSSSPIFFFFFEGSMYVYILNACMYIYLSCICTHLCACFVLNIYIYIYKYIYIYVSRVL